MQSTNQFANSTQPNPKPNPNPNTPPQPSDFDDETRDTLVRALQTANLHLEVLVIGDSAALGPEEASAHDRSLGAIGEVLAQVPGGLRHCPREGDVAGMFPVLYKEGNASYRGPFELVESHINVKVYKKVNPETVSYNNSGWELKRYTQPKPGTVSRPDFGERGWLCWLR